MDFIEKKIKTKDIFFSSLFEVKITLKHFEVKATICGVRENINCNNSKKGLLDLEIVDLG